MSDVKVVYYLEGDPGKERINMALAGDCFPESDAYYLDLLSLPDYRYVVHQGKAVHINDFKTTEWFPLPKGWTYNTELFSIEYRMPDDVREKLSHGHVNNPAEVKAAYEAGLLVKADTIYHGEISEEVDRHKGYRIVKAYPAWTLTYGQKDPSYRRMPCNEVFDTYEQAKEYLRKLKEKRLRLASMSDYEWSLFEIEKVMKFFCPRMQAVYWNLIMEMDNLEYLEVRKREGRMQFRYEGNREWKFL